MGSQRVRHTEQINWLTWWAPLSSWLERKCFWFFAVEDNVCCGFFIYGLYYFKSCSLYAYFLESFYHKWVLNFVKSFFCICWNDHMVLSFNLLIWCITLIDLHTVKNPCVPGIKPTGCMIILMCFCILFTRILLRIFASMFISDTGL